MAMIVISDKCNKYTVKIIFVWPATWYADYTNTIHPYTTMFW